MHCNLRIYCASLCLPEETQSQYFNPKRLKKSRILRGSSLGASSQLIRCRPKLLAFVTVITSQFISRWFGIFSSATQNFQNASSTIPSALFGDHTVSRRTKHSNLSPFWTSTFIFSNLTTKICSWVMGEKKKRDIQSCTPTESDPKSLSVDTTMGLESRSHVQTQGQRVRCYLDITQPQLILIAAQIPIHSFAKHSLYPLDGPVGFIVYKQLNFILSEFIFK